MDNTYGYKEQKGTDLSDELLASSEFEMISITVDTSVRDAGNSPTTYLRRGLVLEYDSGAKNYIVFTTAGKSNTAVVLAENIPGIDAGDTVAKAYYKATFKSGKLLDASTNFDITACQRLSVRDNA